jgi:hypothetical protein
MSTVARKLTLSERVSLAADVAQTLEGTVDDFSEGTAEGEHARQIVRRCVLELRTEARRLRGFGPLSIAKSPA